MSLFQSSFSCSTVSSYYIHTLLCRSDSASKGLTDKKLRELRAEDEPMKEFAVSDRWLWRFSRRHGNHQLSLQVIKAAAELLYTYQL